MQDEIWDFLKLRHVARTTKVVRISHLQTVSNKWRFTHLHNLISSSALTDKIYQKSFFALLFTAVCKRCKQHLAALIAEPPDEPVFDPIGAFGVSRSEVESSNGNSEQEVESSNGNSEQEAESSNGNSEQQEVEEQVF